MQLSAQELAWISTRYETVRVSFEDGQFALYGTVEGFEEPISIPSTGGLTIDEQVSLDAHG